MTDQKALGRQLQAMIEKSQRSLRAAKEHLSKKDFDFASSKAYYAVFHELGDYGYLMKVTAEEVERDLKAAEEITAAISAYLKPYS